MRVHGALLGSSMVGVLAVATRVWPPATVNHDCGWYLHAAAQMLDGARPYVDIVDVNPPLILYGNAWILACGRALGIAPIAAFHAAVFALGALSLWATLRCLPRALTGHARDAALAAFAYLVWVYPRHDFGQREHLVVLALAPYLALRTARATHTEPPAGAIAFGAGLMAAVGCALKPHYLAIPVLLAALDRLRGRSPFVAEHIGLAVGLLLGALHLVLLPADVRYGLGEWGAIAWRTYDAYRVTLGQVVLDPLFIRALAFGAGSFALAAACRRGQPRTRTLLPLGVAWLASLILALAQGKAWSYHFLPALLFAWTAVGVALWTAARRLGASPRLAAALLIGLTLVGSVRVLVDTARAAPQRHAQHDLAGQLHEAAAGGPILALDTQLAPYFPAINYTGNPWTSRFACLWPLPGALRDADTAAETALVDALTADIAARPPTLLVLRAGPTQALPENFDWRAWAAHHPALDALFQRASPPQRIGDLVLYPLP